MEFPPIDQSIQSLKSKINQLQNIIDQVSMTNCDSRSPLPASNICYDELLLVDGCLHASINGGISQYKQIVFKNEFKHKFKLLTSLINQYESILHEAIQLLPPRLRPAVKQF